MSGSHFGQAPEAEDALNSRRREKSAAMRQRLCEAATLHLAELGFFRTSIGKIASRAEVSLGALQHHFPAKDQLIVAVVDHILERSIRWFARAREELARDPDAFAEIVRRSWREQFKSHEYGALLEILTACRTDAALRRRVTPLLEKWRTRIDAELSQLAPTTDRTARELDAMLSISRAMMTGLLVHDELIRDDAQIAFVIDQWIALARR